MWSSRDQRFVCFHTFAGRSFSSRVAASLLNAIGLPELIADNHQKYEKIAIELASNPNKLFELKQRLENNKLKSPLFDTKLYTQHFETALNNIYKKYQNNQNPEHIEIQALMSDTLDQQNLHH
jgi:predicted O-linked N-acetylglucosamine transferase (SPINDLY family)